MLLKLKRTPGIYLVGFMASGKTTIGKHLADEIGWRFVDLDHEIEKEQGSSIGDIFDTQGEEAFRRIESAAIQKRVLDVEKGHPMVMALGGGAFVRADNIDLLQNHGITLWLDCPFSIVSARVGQASHRPLARDPERFLQLYLDRRASYAKSDYRIEVSGDDPAQAVAAILNLPIF